MFLYCGNCLVCFYCSCLAYLLSPSRQSSKSISKMKISYQSMHQLTPLCTGLSSLMLLFTVDIVFGYSAVDSGRDLLTSISEEDVDDGYDNDSPFITLEGGLKIPEAIFRKLFDYQKVGVQWLWELHCQRAGGIIGDEMGLGKTIQVLSFLGALHFSNMYKPSIVVCPVTLLRQWKREAQKWYPRFHVELLHDSAQDVSGRDPLKKKRAQSYESDCETEDSLDSDYERSMPSRKANKWDSLINRVFESDSGLLITTYEQLRLLGEKLLDFEWGYAVLDEGHRIRNPNAEITLVCKQLQTVHRIIMTGAPIQNKLNELWSLFDFVFPGKLGVLPVFEAEFAVPISVGGYANASPLQVSTAYRCTLFYFFVGGSDFTEINGISVSICKLSHF